MCKILVLLFSFFIFIESTVAGEVMAIEKYLLSEVEKQVHKECPSCQIDMEIHNKKILNDVAVPDQVIADHWKGQTNLVLKMGEDTRVVTVTIRWMDKVVVAKKNIKQGKVITAKDVRVVDKDVTFLKTSYIQNVKNSVGWVGRRIFKRGQVIDEALLTKPLVVRYGQSIKLQLKMGGLNLSVTGKAKGAGAIGDSIPVLIPNTRKKVSAIIIDKNTARIE